MDTHFAAIRRTAGAPSGTDAARRPALATAALALALSGCTFIPAHRLAQDSCLFGGASAAADLACASRNFGIDGQLAAANAPVPGDCKDHVLAVARRLGGRYPTAAVVACPSFMDVCHASALVHTPDGDFVLDNGALGFPGNRLTLAEYRAWLDADDHEVVSLDQIRRLARNAPGTVAAAP
jgi:hypothetical protein